MEQPRRIESLEIVGGHPSLDLTNTISSHFGGGMDRLETVEDVAIWGVRTGLLGEEEAARLRAAPPADLLPRLRVLREAVYRVFAARVAGREALAEDVTLISDAAARAAAVRRLQVAGAAIRWSWPAGALLEKLAFGAAELLTGPDAGRVKVCQGRNCGWLFLDTTRNNSRCWCSDKDCGTGARVARHRARKRALARKAEAPGALA